MPSSLAIKIRTRFLFHFSRGLLIAHRADPQSDRRRRAARRGLARRSTGGPEVRLAPSADPGDGLLDVVLVAPADRGALREYVEARLTGRGAEAPRFEVRRGRELSLQVPADGVLRVDDEPWPDAASRHEAGAAVVRAAVQQGRVLAPTR